MKRTQKRTFRSLTGSVLFLVLGAFWLVQGCSADTAPAGGVPTAMAGTTMVAMGTGGTVGTTGGTPSAAAGTSTVVGPIGGTTAVGQGGTTVSASGGALPAATGGTSAGGTLAAQGGMAAGAGAPGAAGMPAMGPPAFSDKPMSVIAYSPYRDGQAPGGPQPTEAQVREDLVMLQPLVDGIRIYGTDGANGYIPALCDELGIDLHIGAWIDGLASDEPNALALAAIVNEDHPSIKTAIVGNEVLHRATKNMMTEERMIELINMVRDAVTVPNVLIATADTYPVWIADRPNYAAAADVLIWHTYGWWAGADITGAYDLVASRYQEMRALYPGKPMILGETGWPSQIDHMSADMTTTSVGNEENQAKYYRDILGGFRQWNLPVWMFSAIDEKWKASQGEGDVGEFWGIFNSDRTPKLIATEMLSGN